MLSHSFLFVLELVLPELPEPEFPELLDPLELPPMVILFLYTLALPLL